jgi:hypothetical protein
MATINFFIQSKNNPATIYIRLREGRKSDSKAKTKFLINPTDWSANKGQPKNTNDASFKKLNSELKKLSSDLLYHYNDRVGIEEINSIWLKKFLSPPQKIDSIPTRLTEYIDYYSKHKKNAIGSSTYKRNNVYKRLIDRFEKSKNTTFFIKDVNADFKLDFEDYCENQGYAPNTTARTIKFIKTICYHARSNGAETHFQLDNISVKLKKGRQRYSYPLMDLDLIESKALRILTI